MSEKPSVNPPFSTAEHDHGNCVSLALAKAESLCRQRGQRLTALRRRVLELVWDNHQPVGAYALLEKMRGEKGRMAPATVYRALDFLQDQGLVHRLASLNAFIGCAFPDSRHAGQFLICSSCRQLAELDDSRVTAALQASAESSGFAIGSSTVEIMGLCPNCREKQG